MEKLDEKLLVEEAAENFKPGDVMAVTAEVSRQLTTLSASTFPPDSYAMRRIFNDRISPYDAAKELVEFHYRT